MQEKHASLGFHSRQQLPISLASSSPTCERTPGRSRFPNQGPFPITQPNRKMHFCLGLGTSSANSLAWQLTRQPLAPELHRQSQTQGWENAYLELAVYGLAQKLSVLDIRVCFRPQSLNTAFSSGDAFHQSVAAWLAFLELCRFSRRKLHCPASCCRRALFWRS